MVARFVNKRIRKNSSYVRSITINAREQIVNYRFIKRVKKNQTRLLKKSIIALMGTFLKNLKESHMILEGFGANINKNVEEDILNKTTTSA